MNNTTEKPLKVSLPNFLHHSTNSQDKKAEKGQIKEVPRNIACMFFLNDRGSLFIAQGQFMLDYHASNYNSEIDGGSTHLLVGFNFIW